MSAPSLLAAYSLDHGPPVIFSQGLRHLCVIQEDHVSCLLQGWQPVA